MTEEIVGEKTETSPGATQGMEQILATLAEADHTVPDTMPERMLEVLLNADTTIPRNIMIPPISVQSELFILTFFL